MAEWVKYADRYEVSSEGDIRNAKTKRVLVRRESGHIELAGKTYRWGRVVLEAFGVPKTSDTDVAIRIDREKWYSLDNLKWGTKQEAAVDWTKLRDIQLLAAQGLSNAEIQRRTGADYVTVKTAAPYALDGRKGRGRNWSEERKLQIGLLVADGASLNDIRALTGADPRTIKRHFPNAGWAVGGGGKAAEARRGRKMINELELK